MITDSFMSLLSERLDTKFHKTISISGGDISDAYLLETANERFFLKVNTGEAAEDMFAKEARALKLLGSVGAIRTPQVIDNGQLDKTAFLLLEFIESKTPDPGDFENSGSALAQLHQQSAEQFGSEENNYIGSLVQSNTEYKDWCEFYARERLWAQLQVAQSNGLMQIAEVPELGTLESRLRDYFTEVKPALLHGDLWSGNFLIAHDGTPTLIDPAAYYGHALVDIAMSKLFGGFGARFYQGYHDAGGERFSASSNEIYQLYYLLVHLNLFGPSYYPKVKNLLDRYFG